jgi:mannose/fructose/N-acetylgalactosamine-specific phosphotransferase system component IIB
MTIHLILVLESKIAHHAFLKKLLARGRPAGIFKWRMFHVQRRIIERQFQRIESVPLVSGPET